LVVDDDRMILEVTSSVVQKFGFQVISASNGEEAVRNMDRYLYAVITDFHMPIFNGNDVARFAKKIGIGRIILCSSALPEGYCEPGIIIPEPGLFYRRIGKPYKLAELASALS
ncbi:MAG: response regulator, partial [Candidatus Moranbacteria bacterium]|nr:response regulator [Candidatus Moranbacteria bacterium]